MFKCSGCPEKYNRKRKLIKNNTGHGVKLFKVVTVRRAVRYINQIRFDKIVPDGEGCKLITSFKDLEETTGKEIVEERNYCKDHIPKNLTVKLLPEVKRKVLVGIRRPHKGEN